MRSKIERFYFLLLQTAERSLLVWLLLSPLILLSALFGSVLFVRRYVFAILRRGRKVAASVVTVGNVTVGGTGKTPVILSLLAHLNTKKHKIAYVGRGYRREIGGLRVGHLLDPKEIGDEASLVQRRNNNVIVSICDDKWKAIQAVDDRVDFIILDDGLQRYDIPIDYTIATVDCLSPDGFGWQLPRGLLREPFSRLKETDVLILTNATDIEVVEKAKEKVKPFCLPTIVTRPTIANFFTPDGNQCSLATTTPVALLCSIAHPEQFSLSMQRAGYTVVETLELLDHVDIKNEKLIQWADCIQTLYKGVVIVATEKDWARKSVWPSLSVPLLFSHLELEIVEGKEEFDALIDRMRTMACT
jgi:tetraacyldisaccharide 4'-kinase